MNTSKLKQEIENAEEALARMKQELEDAEKMNSKDYYPSFKNGNFNVHECLKAIDGSPAYLATGFDWRKTQQGYDYWAEKSWGKVPLTDEDKITILRWCVNYYRSKNK